VEDEDKQDDPAERVARRLDATGRRLAEVSEAMEETRRRQDEIQRRQGALLDQLERLARAMEHGGEGKR
jgi:hypothetical protein